MICVNRFQMSDYGLCVYLALWIRCVSAADFFVNVSVTTSKLSWFEAAADAAPCNIVGKELPQSVKLRDIRINPLNHNAYLNLSDVWIGAYVKYTEWLNFKGCSRINTHMTLDMGIYLPVDNDELIAACALRCKTSTFVIALNTCFCGFYVRRHYSRRDFRYGGYPDMCGYEMKPCRKQGELCVDSKGISCGCSFNPIDVNVSAAIGHNCLSVVSADVEYEFNPEMCNKKLPSIYKMDYDRYRKSEVNVSFLASLQRGPLRRPGRRPFSEFISVDDMKSRAFNESIGQIKPYWTGIFRKEYILWATNDTIKEPHHCIAVSFEKDGSLTPYIRPCHEKLPSMCTTYRNTSTSADLIKQRENLENPMTSYATFIAIGVTEGIVACTVIVVGFLLHKKYKNEKKIESDESRTNAIEISATYEALSPNQQTSHTETMYSELSTIRTQTPDTNVYGNI